MNNNSDQFCAHWEGEVVSPISTKEFLAMLEEEALAQDVANDPDRFLSDRDRRIKREVEAQEQCRRACVELKELIRTRLRLIFGAIGKPVIIPASLIGVVIAGLFAKGDIGPVIAATGVAADFGGTMWFLQKAIKKYGSLRYNIHKCRRTIQDAREKYGPWIVTSSLMEAGLDSEEDWF